MALFKFIDPLIECGQLELKALDLCVIFGRPDWLPNPLCLHDASPAMVTPS
jgi:hypothetical protein